MPRNEDFTVGVDVGASKIMIGAVTEGGEILRQRKHRMDRMTRESVLQSISCALDEFVADQNRRFRMTGIGIGLVGQTDIVKGVWVQSINLPIKSPVPVAAIIGDRYGVPTVIDNDVHAAAFAELKLGAGRSHSDFILFNLGTGIALGMVAGNTLLRGASNYAGEMGHMVVDRDGIICACGRKGCLETMASGGGLAARAEHLLQRNPPRLPTGKNSVSRHSYTSIFHMAKEGDDLAQSLLENAIQSIEQAIVDVANLLNPGAIVLSGGVFANYQEPGSFAHRLLERLRSNIVAKVLPAVRAALQEVGVSTLEADTVGMVGAALLSWESRKVSL
jgi:glucokinase